MFAINIVLKTVRIDLITDKNKDNNNNFYALMFKKSQLDSWRQRFTD